MTKLTVSRLFDKATVSSTNAAKELEPFIDYVSQFIDNVSRALRSGIDVADNLAAKYYTFSFQHGVISTVLIPGKPKYITIAKESIYLSDGSAAPAITSFQWEYSLIPDNVNILIKTDDPTNTAKISVDLLVIYS